jgi:hypothetical protein
MPETIPIRPADLLIDEENPRLSEPNAGQHEAQRALAQHLGKKLTAMAVDIVNFGLNPSELPIVMAHASNPSRYVVLEGNRRLAALRAMENPESLADAVSADVLKKIRKLSKEYQKNPIEEVTCTVVKSREEARHWVELKHTGLNDGAGLFPWGSDETSRWLARLGKPPQPHTQALDFLQKRGDLTQEVRRRVKPTSLKRLIETPAVREKLGLELQNGTLYLLADPTRIAKALMHVVNDLASGRTKVGDIYKKPDRLKYAKNLPASVVVTATAKSGQGIAITTGEKSAKPKAGGRTAKTPKKRDKLIPRDCILNIPRGRINDIEGELRILKLSDHTNAVSVLFRVFIELSLDAYIISHPLGITEKEPLHKKLEKVATDLETRKKLNPQQAKAVRHASMKDSFLDPGVTLLNAYVHNQYVFPSVGDLRTHWDKLQPFIAAMWTP